MQAELPRKYSGLARREKDEADEDEQVYSTSEGRCAAVPISGTGVFVSEGFPLALARKLRDGIVSVQSDAPLQIATADAGMDYPARVLHSQIQVCRWCGCFRRQE